ncbi:SLC13 family permease [Bradyrhizobium septentrionale]|uniref:Anion permease n=1 Tax=Bradyrhizobium septentrionale TaxID=1404411 RepID=A0A974A1Z8_9BRAD|nr:SLC13 family permease [Bradyrhizobium septentrionale]UGY13962.1 anion permease [Bradyrhizobium septentrionale]UGY22516.1 anion permease [Bradyrhizobium septentrionale]
MTETASSLIHPGWFAAIAILLWATSLLPEFLTALLFFAAVAVFRAAPPDVLFSGFQSEAFWLVLGGFVIGSAIRKVGLADRIARALAGHLTGSWLRMVAGVILLTYALAFVMPSNMGRIALLMPIILALADRAGLSEGSPGRHALALAVGFGTYQLSASILPANVPNLIMTGAAERAYGVRFDYMSYLVLHAPVIGILKGIVLIGCLVWLFPASPKPIEGSTETTPMSAAEWRLSIILLATLAFWMTDSLHGIRPAWVGLVSACLCLLPRVGFLNGEEFAAGVNVRTCIYLGGILGLAAVVAWSGLGTAIGNLIIPHLPLDPARPAADFASMIGLASLLNFVVTANGVPAVFTPLASSLAAHTGLTLPTVLMSQVFAYATPLLPYQAAPIVVAAGMARVPTSAAVKVCLLVGLISFVVLAPLYLVWFRLLGWIG